MGELILKNSPNTSPLFPLPPHILYCPYPPQLSHPQFVPINSLIIYLQISYFNSLPLLL